MSVQRSLSLSSLSSSSSSSSTASSVDPERPSIARSASKESTNTQQRTISQREVSVPKSVDHTVRSETNTVRSNSPAVSHISVESTNQRLQDAASVQSRDGRNTNNVSSVSTTTTNLQQQQQQQVARDPLPTVVVGPQPPRQVVSENTTSNVNRSIQNNVNSAQQQQQQQRAVQPTVSSYSGPTSSYTHGSLSSATNTSFPQPRPTNTSTTVPIQSYIHPTSGVNQQGPQNTHSTNGQFYHHPPQSQFANQLFGADDFKDSTLNIDYGAIEAYNIGMQAPDNFTGAQLPGGGGVAAAAAAGGRQFDIVKAVFNQVDANRDGTISQQEFRQWAQQGTQNYGAQSYSNYQSAPATANYEHRFSGPQLLDSTNPEAMRILQQSGLGRFVN